MSTSYAVLLQNLIKLYFFCNIFTAIMPRFVTFFRLGNGFTAALDISWELKYNEYVTAPKMRAKYNMLCREVFMIKVRSKMFEESAKSHASSSIVATILLFIIVFFIIYLLEGIIPSIAALKPMAERFETLGYLSDTSKLTVKESIRVASDISGEPRIMLPSLYCTVFGTLTAMFYCRMVEMRPVRSMGAVKKGALRSYLIGIAVGIVLMSAITLLSVLFGVNSIAVRSGINFSMIALYFGGFLVQGMSEEFIFRGYLMNSVGGKHSAALAVGISALAFGLAHAANPGFNALALLNLVLFAVFASLYMLNSDNIWGVCAIHSIWNFMQGNFYGISVSGAVNADSFFITSAKSSHGFLTGGEFGIEGSIFTTLVLTAAIAAVLYAMIKNKRLFSQTESGEKENINENK